MLEIEFIPFHKEAALYPPLPAKDMIPEWINRLKFKENNVGTIKSCPVVIDYLLSGYFLRSHKDLVFERYVVDNEEYITMNGVQQPNCDTSEGIDPDGIMLAFKEHVSFQTKIKKTLWKLDTGWRYSTPEGYSSLVTSNFYGLLPYQCLPFIIDTDYYQPSVSEIPFITSFNDNNSYEWEIKKGDPLALLFPVKRENWSRKISDVQEIQRPELLRSFNLNTGEKHFVPNKPKRYFK